MQRFTRVCAFTAPLLCLPLFAQQTFVGTLDPQLHSSHTNMAHTWAAATPDERKNIPEPLAAGDEVLVGSLIYDSKGQMTFPAALIRKADGTAEFYINLNHEGAFSAGDKHIFHAVTSDESQMNATTVELDVPLKHGPYPTMRVVVGQPSPHMPAFPGHPRPNLMVSLAPYIDGTVQLPDRSLAVRFNFDPASGGVDLKHGKITMDTLGAGKIADDSESRDGDGVLPIFHVGTLYLRVAAVDLAAHTFTVESVPSSAFTRFDLVPGATLPDFSYTGLDGTVHKFSELGGKYRLIDFWATWCVPCVMDLASKQQLYAKYHARGLEILGIDGSADSLDAAAKLIAEKSIPWPQAAFDHDLVENRFGVYAYPTFVLVDAAGKILEVSRGGTSGGGADLFDKSLATLLAPAASN